MNFIRKQERKKSGMQLQSSGMVSMHLIQHALVFLLITLSSFPPTAAASSLLPPGPPHQSFLRRRNTTTTLPGPWTWKFPPRTTAAGSSNSTSSYLRDRDLIINEKTEEEQASLLHQFNPLTLLSSDQGHRANLNQYPYFAHWSNAFCGASLIHDDILLTAAHCGKESDNPLDIKEVRLLSEFRKEGGFQRVVVHQEVHPDYNAEIKVYDFQLLKLERSALVNEFGNATTGASIVRLNANFYHPPVGAEVTAVGFGTTSTESPSASDLLMDVTLNRFDHRNCEDQYGPHRIPDDVCFCMGVEGGGKDVCQGDSGGPIVDKNGTQVAVVSWGHGCARADYYGINARVSSAVPWIQRQICRLSSYPPDSCDKAAMQSVLHRPPQQRGCHGHNGSQPPPQDLQTPNIGTIALRVNVLHDKYPQETSWDFRHLDSFVQLHWQPYKSVTQPFVTVTKQFVDLPPGTYQFRIADKGFDGTCCDYGNGSMSITATVDDDQEAKVLWSHKGNFFRYLQVTLELSVNGTVIFQEETQKYTSPSIAATKRNQPKENNPAKNDPDWPGAYPMQSETNSMSVNVRHDDFPEQVEWAVWYYKPIHENSTNLTTIGDETIPARHLQAAVTPATAPPVSSAPASAAPITAPPNSAAPITAAPASVAPATAQPITAAPITAAPISSPPVSAPPVSAAPMASAAPATAPAITAAPISAPPASAPPVEEASRRKLVNTTRATGPLRAQQSTPRPGSSHNTAGIDHKVTVKKEMQKGGEAVEKTQKQSSNKIKGKTQAPGIVTGQKQGDQGETQPMASISTSDSDMMDQETTKSEHDEADKSQEVDSTKSKMQISGNNTPSASNRTTLTRPIPIITSAIAGKPLGAPTPIPIITSAVAGKPLGAPTFPKTPNITMPTPIASKPKKCANFFDYVFNDESVTIGDIFGKVGECVGEFSGSFVPEFLKDMTLPEAWENLTSVEFMDYIGSSLDNITKPESLENVNIPGFVEAEKSGESESETNPTACSRIFDDLLPGKEVANNSTGDVGGDFFEKIGDCISSLFGNVSLPEGVNTSTLTELGEYFSDFLENSTLAEDLGETFHNVTASYGESQEEKSGNQFDAGFNDTAKSDVVKSGNQTSESFRNITLSPDVLELDNVTSSPQADEILAEEDFKPNKLSNASSTAIEKSNDNNASGTTNGFLVMLNDAMGIANEGQQAAPILNNGTGAMPSFEHPWQKSATNTVQDSTGGLMQASVSPNDTDVVVSFDHPWHKSEAASTDSNTSASPTTAPTPHPTSAPTPSPTKALTPPPTPSPTDVPTHPPSHISNANAAPISSDVVTSFDQLHVWQENAPPGTTATMDASNYGTGDTPAVGKSSEMGKTFSNQWREDNVATQEGKSGDEGDGRANPGEASLLEKLGGLYKSFSRVFDADANATGSSGATNEAQTSTGETTHDGERVIVVMNERSGGNTEDSERQIEVESHGNDSDQFRSGEAVQDGAENVKVGNLTLTKGALHPVQPSSKEISTEVETSDHKWMKLYQSGISDGLSNTVETHFFYHMQPGLYAFVLHDTKGDGICCQHRSGWMAILGNQTVVWNHNGEFSEKIHVVVELKEGGTFHVVKATIDNVNVDASEDLLASNQTNSTSNSINRAQEEGVVSAASASHNDTA